MEGTAQDNGLTSTQNALIRWQAAIAFGPFMFVVLFAQTGVANSLPRWMELPSIFIPVIWAVVFEGYVLYLNYQKS